MTQLAIETQRETRRSSTAVWIGILFLAALGIRIGFGWYRSIVPDEAVYWTWSRHLAGGYLDHPPMVAYLIHLGTRMLGSNELGVRLFSILPSLATAGLMVWLCNRLLRDPRATLWCALVLLASPMLAVLGAVMTPDPATFFFSACAMVIAVLLADRPDDPAPGRWLLFGLFCGLALLTKYIAILLPASVVAALLTDRAARAHLRRPWIYLSAIVALLVFFPVIHWNAQHHWISFRFQLNHGLATHDDESGSAAHHGEGARILSIFANLGAYVGGQMVLWNPLLLAVGGMAVVAAGRRYRHLAGSRKVLLWCALVPLVFFGLASARTLGEINWPAFSYFPLTLLTVEFVAQTYSGARLDLLRTGTIVALIASIVVQTPEVLMAIRVPLPRKFDELYGWPEFCRELEAKRGGRQVVAGTQRDAGEMAFYLPGQPEVLVYTGGSRPASADYFDDRPNPAAFPSVAYVGKHAELFCRQYGFTDAGGVKTPGIKIRLRTGRVRPRPVRLLDRVEPGAAPTTQPSRDEPAEE